MRVVAQQRISWLIGQIVGGGICFCIAFLLPWIAEPVHWFEIGLRLWFCFGGVLAIWTGIKGWHPKGHGLVFNEDGIQWQMGSGLPMRPWLVSWRWDEIIEAKLVHVNDLDCDPYKAIILILKTTASHALSPKQTQYLAKHLHERFGIPLSENVAFVEPHDWKWNPEEVVQWINESVNDPMTRLKWGKANEPSDNLVNDP